MNNKYKRLWTYVLITLLMMVAAGAVIYIAGKPVLNYALSYIDELIVKGSIR